jgi:hypothetical protein
LARETRPCRQRSWIADVPTFRDWEDPFPVLARSLAERRLDNARIGLDFGSYCMPLARFERLKAALPRATFVDVGPVVWDLRLIKSPAEIALLRQAAGVADEAMRRAAMMCVRGASQRAAAKEAVAAYIELGADPSPPGPISARSLGTPLFRKSGRADNCHSARLPARRSLGHRREDDSAACHGLENACMAFLAGPRRTARGQIRLIHRAPLEARRLHRGELC